MVELDYDLLYELTNQGIAERITQEERDAIHIETPLDDKIRRELEQGNQVVLTGNPGDGKSQYVQRFKQHESFPPSDYFYIVDASEYETEELAEEWADAVDAGTAGILAVNDGILNNMAEWAQSEDARYAFLTQSVLRQLENQVVFEATDQGEFDAQFTTIDLGNRSFISEVGDETDSSGEVAVRRVIETLTEQIAPEARADAENHAESNAAALQEPLVTKTLGRLLSQFEGAGEHMTVRDILNFVAYCITGGRSAPDESVDMSDYTYGLHYYNLAMDPDGVYLSQALAEQYDPYLTSLPTTDIQLWDEIDETVSYAEYEFEELQDQFVCLKRAALFGDSAAPERYEEGFIDQFLKEQERTEFEDYIEEDVTQPVVNFTRILNHYFTGTHNRDELRIWFDHNYEYDDPDVLVSGNTVDVSHFDVKVPELHPELSDALGYTPPYFVFGYQVDDDLIARLQVDYPLFRFLSSGGEETPTSISSQVLENRVVQFMEQINQRREGTENDIRIKNKESGDITKIKLSPSGHAYSLE
jgi:hypothetical protein